MKGRAHQLLTEFSARCQGPRGAFAMSRLILMAKVFPEDITPELDDPDVEQKLEAAIATIEASMGKK